MPQQPTFLTSRLGAVPISPDGPQPGWRSPPGNALPVSLQATSELRSADTSISLTTHAERPQRSIRIVVVDDQVIMRAGIQFSLLDYDDIEVVAMVGSGEEALEACMRLHPDVVLMDLLMPGMGGIEAIKALHEDAPEIHAIALSGIAEGNIVEDALRAGATGYLLKDVDVPALADAIRLAERGIPSLAPAAGQALAHTVASRPPRIGQDLTPQARKVLELLAAGLSNQQIAEQLVITQATVKFHIRRIRSKLGTSTRTETAVQALRHQLVPSQ